ncbi:exonuclease V subunit beta [Desulfosporosinus sp. HMP52]|uniref:UvrD-helicase domain-containing protein n=1 Tax=Desulfosporosinus sp. HMP52 TaxID=1487923 RepID=UPI00051FEE94|nr:UvrD-helicase domain-containing protein [Desulfosporosinus sp. HMP52]KGK89158.1 exonuclease V subunit beta [Desulfosporosinus sp. HMP52]
MPKLANPPDYEERLRLQQELFVNFLVDAGAGSGKTSSLVRRMVNLVKSGGVTTQQIAAITFTRKATYELRERFQITLEKAYREEKNPNIKEKLQLALVNLDQCFLGTIHSFCASLLRERPIEAGLDPEFEELDPLEEILLQEEAWESYLMDVKLNSSGLLERLDDIGVPTTELKEAFITLSQYSDVTMVCTEVSKPDLQPAMETLKNLVERAIKSIPNEEPEKGWDHLQKAILKANRFFKFFNMNKDFTVVNLLKAFDKEFSVTQNRWISKDEAKQCRDDFNEFTVNILSPAMQTWREYCHYILIEFMIPAVQFYEQVRFKQSKLNFQDLLLITRNMLREHPEVRAYFHDKYPRLLVDEFQDTDPVQAEILFYLTGQDINQKDWHKLIPHPGSLFVVGDAKQSIYRFRRADIDTYNLVKKLIIQSGGEVVQLTTNFRSVEALGQWINPIFQTIFPEQESSYQAEFSPLRTLRPDGKGSVYGVKVLNIPAEFTKKDEILNADAEMIAQFIRWSLDGNLKLTHPSDQTNKEEIRQAQPEDFMILLRFKDGMDLYARALEKFKIPFSMTGGSSLGDSLELAELYKLLRLLSDPDDQLLMVGVLRGLFFGISDDDLFQIKQAGGYFRIYSNVPEGLHEDLETRYGKALDKLKKYLQWAEKMMPSVAIEKILADLGMIPYVLGFAKSESGASYFYQVLEFLRKAERNGKTRFDQIVTEFSTIMSSSIEEELSLTTKEENVVRLMNVHKAKGLEASVVFLAQPFKEVSQKADIHIRRHGTEPEGYYVFNRKLGYHSERIAQPDGWCVYENEELRYLQEEEYRLVYVAGTRSKNLLIISRSLKDMDLRKNPWALLIQGSSAENELNAPEIEIVSDNPDEIGTYVKPQELIAAREHFSMWVSALAKPSYQIVSPTGLKEQGIDLSVKRGAGGGKAWGNVIHQVFEELIKGNDDIDSVITLALQENEESLERKEEVYRVVEKFCRTDLWQRITQAESKYTEVSFSLQIDNGHPLNAYIKGANEKPVILSGIIDLAFKENGQWVIVDYKTDRVNEESDLDRLREFYAPQLKMYCEVWNSIIGESCQEGQLYFVEKNQLKNAFS